MRKIQKNFIFTFCFILGLSIISKAEVYTAVKTSGNWADADTWDKNKIPDNGALVIIPAQITVNVTTNMYPAVSKLPTIEIKIYGNLTLYTGQLNLSCGSSICVFDDGMIYGNNTNGSQLMFGGGKAEWMGMFDGTLQEKCISGDCFVLSFEQNSNTISENKKQSIKPLFLYPNPVQQGHYLNWSEENFSAEIQKIELSTLQGQILYSLHSIDNSGIEIVYQPGYYILSIYTEKEILREKIWVK